MPQQTAADADRSGKVYDFTGVDAERSGADVRATAKLPERDGEPARCVLDGDTYHAFAEEQDNLKGAVPDEAGLEFHWRLKEWTIEATETALKAVYATLSKNGYSFVKDLRQNNPFEPAREYACEGDGIAVNFAGGKISGTVTKVQGAGKAIRMETDDGEEVYVGWDNDGKKVYVTGGLDTDIFPESVEVRKVAIAP